MAETIVTIAAADLDRLVYVAIAEARDDAETELLTGLADRVLLAEIVSNIEESGEPEPPDVLAPTLLRLGLLLPT